MQNEINELRNQVRTLKRMLFGVFGVVVLGALLAATTFQNVPDVIQANRFEVINAEGNPVVVLDSVSEQYKNGGRIRVHSATADIVAQIDGTGRKQGFSLWYDGAVIAHLGQDEGSGVLGVTSYWKGEEKGNRKRVRTGAALMASMDGDFQPKVFLLDDAGTPLMFPPSKDSFPIGTWKLESRGRESQGQW
jgi:hypothetical protein